MSFSDRLLELFPGKSMADIARELKVPHSTIRNYVQHGRLPSADVLITITNHTNVSLNWLLSGTGQKSADADSLGNLEGLLDAGHMQALEDLRDKWKAENGHKTSWNDFLKIMITWGENSVRRSHFEEQFKSNFDDLEYAVNAKSIVSQSIIELIRFEMKYGDLRQVILDIVKNEVADVDSVEIVDLGPRDIMLAHNMGTVDGGEEIENEEATKRKKKTG